MRLDPLFSFVIERHAVYERRATGRPAPWTDDPILRQWSFCNVYRELDRVTRWVADNWRNTHADDPDLWFAMVVARKALNWPDSMAELGYPVPWDAGRFLRMVQRRRQAGLKVYGDAYLIGTDGQSMPKHEYLARRVLDPLWRDRAALHPRRGDTLAAFATRLLPYKGIDTFIAGQVAADLKYVEPLRSASDWHTWATPGKGSKRGLNRLLGRPVGANWQERDWTAQLRSLHQRIEPCIEMVDMPPLHAQDLQNCLCEFDKYERVRLREGKPKRRFVPRAGRPHHDVT